MLRKFNSTLLLAGALLIAGNSCKNSSNKMNDIVKDAHSYADPNLAKVSHLKLNLKVDFQTKILSGKAVWDIVPNGEADSIFFDNHGLVIEKVLVDNAEAKFQMGQDNADLGKKLAVAITGGSKEVAIFYHTVPEASALQWLPAEQTAGKKYPFLFSQSQAILARTWIPCQDSPGIRFTYEAEIVVPEGYMALMSATNPQELHNDGHYNFRQDKPIPSYLMALAVGHLEFTPLGQRTGVYAESETIAKAKFEFSQMEEMLVAAEKLYGPYQWGRYDVLVLPPSFPFGGMENPCLTFATPTILAGDKSLVSLIAHELAHSWSGNLVTNATWNDFWLNEGFTVYFERRIMEAIEGEEYANMLAKIGEGDLKETLEEIGAQSKDTHLKLDLKGRNPDDGMNDIAYEKGYFFLTSLEKKVGREKFDAFLKEYFTSHAFGTITTEAFIEYLSDKLFKGDEAALAETQYKEWIYGPGLPSNFEGVSATRFNKVEEAVRVFKVNGDAGTISTEGWSSHEWVHFLRSLPNNMPAYYMEHLDMRFALSKTGNSEIACVWFQKAITCKYDKAFPYMREFLAHVGRRKFVLPLYKSLVNTGQENIAVEWYHQYRSRYHAVTVNSLDKLFSMKSHG